MPQICQLNSRKLYGEGGFYNALIIHNSLHRNEVCDGEDELANMVLCSGPVKEEYCIMCWNILGKLLEFVILQEGKVDNKNCRHLKKISQCF